MNYLLIDTPIGTLKALSNGRALLALNFEHQYDTSIKATQKTDAVLHQTATQLTEYFSGERTSFNLPCAATGTEFQRAVWEALNTIPFGETRCYGDIAVQIGKPRAVRAVGAANGKNPLPIIVPCHRVIGRNGTLTGFAGGLAIKTALLQLEGSLML